MIFRQLFDQETSTYTYLLADKLSKEAVLIDPVIENIERDVTLLKELGLKLKYAIDTHVHADHVTATGELRDRTGCETGISKKGDVKCSNMHLHEGAVLHFGAFHIDVLETPGHTDGCLSFVCDKRVFTGDALLIRGCGRTDLQQGDTSILYASITTKLYTLPDETQVFPGHDYHGLTVSSIGEEKQYNPRLILGEDGFVAFMQQLELDDPKKIHEAVPANLACGQIHKQLEFRQAL
ncbi:MAG: MBL fold metallo-hydrolase [Mariprofundus sp.]|nr:MBL fold metallo-hydrolase [Mariprofundus sp.]